MLADLHIHSTSSDGVYTPFALIEQAQQAHLKAIALTDHDNTEGFIRLLTARFNGNL